MAEFEPRHVPDETTEITHTGHGGVQLTIRITHGKKGALAHPETAADVRALDALFPLEPDLGGSQPGTAADGEPLNQDTETAPAAGEQEA